MPIKLIKKSNKTQTIGETVDQSPGKGKGVLVPFIDKVSLVVVPANDEDAKAIHSNIFTQIKDKEVFHSAGLSGEHSGGFHVVKLITLHSTHQRALFQYRHVDHKANKLRLEFNPRKIGPQGLMELHAILTSIVPNGWAYIVEHSHITRIDIAVDIPNVRVDEFLFLPKQGITSREWATDGHLETLRFGKPKGNQTLVYSVKKKRLAQGKNWLGNSKTRVERRLRNPVVKKLTELGEMQNPFASMVLTNPIPPPPTDEKPNAWSMFEDCVNVRGLVPALALVSIEKRKKYRAHLEAHPESWWDPEAIWSNWTGAYMPLLKHST